MTLTTISGEVRQMGNVPTFPELGQQAAVMYDTRHGPTEGQHAIDVGGFFYAQMDARDKYWTWFYHARIQVEHLALYEARSSPTVSSKMFQLAAQAV